MRIDRNLTYEINWLVAGVARSSSLRDTVGRGAVTDRRGVIDQETGSVVRGARRGGGVAASFGG